MPTLYPWDQIFVNRNLRMKNIRYIGFDLDYTLAEYRQHNFEALAFEKTLEKLVADKGYPASIKELSYNPDFMIRGLVVDKALGNILKINGFAYVGQAYHGLKELPREQRKSIYRERRVNAGHEDFVSVDTMFALPEAYLFAALVDKIDAGLKVPAKDYSALWTDINRCIDLAHSDGSIKDAAMKNLTHYLQYDPTLLQALAYLRDAGKKLFIITNSEWEYAEHVMNFLFKEGDHARDWREYFEIVVAEAAKPRFFTQSNPFQPIDYPGVQLYKGGNLADFEKLTGARGDEVLYVGDHIYGDILRSKKDSFWRTVSIIQELDESLHPHYHPIWGDIFVEHGELSAFGQQIKDYACIYMSRVQSFLNYPVSTYFQSQRQRMPHEEGMGVKA